MVYFSYQAFMLFTGLFATIAYNGAVGIIFSVPVWFSCTFSFIAMVFDDDQANLNLTLKWW